MCKLSPNVSFNDEGRKLGEDDVIAFLSNCDAAIIGTEPLSERVIASLPSIKFYAKYGVGLDNVDLEALAKRGIPLGWTGGVNRRSVSELALCLMLMLCRNIQRISPALARGVWDKDGGRLLSGRSIGIVGCGFVGEDLLSLLAPMGGARLICDIVDKSEVGARFSCRQVPYKELLEEADIISFHVPLTTSTRHMLGEAETALLKPGTIVINTSRGPVFDQGALKKALQTGRISAGLDVFTDEPPSDLEFLGLPNLAATPHVGGNAAEAVLAMGLSAIGHLARHFGSPPPT